MLSGSRWIVLGLVLTAPILRAQDSASIIQPRPHSRHQSHKTQAPVVLPPLPSGPLSQLPMDQIPATPAKVSYQDGLLTISAQNSTLGEILRDVRRLTGASIEIPQGSGANERVVTNLGPGAPRDVLAGLLNGSGFNYVMLGSSADPGAVASVVLTQKPSSPGDVQTAANVYQNTAPEPPVNRFQPRPFDQQNLIMPRPGNGQPGAEAPADADDTKDDEEKDDDNAEDQAQPQPGQAEAAGPGAQEQQPDPNQPNAGPKTPEQILEMLRRQQPGAQVINPPQQPQQPPQEQ